ncbi:MAG: 50S ribosomal protein L24 [bacterium TMED198]|nr:MAG: 50S ribosomal protein L24 [bacterium TMED198]|tara:strand:- start:1334 stop:1639 length:306 start_codon:yes stop_codon:yes gene_type:complete
MKIKKNDIVKVVSGNDKGKEGRVIKVYKDSHMILVEGVKLVKKHARPTQDNPKGGIITMEKPIHISNVMLVFKKKPVKVGYKILKDGSKTRVIRSTADTIS